MKRVVTDAEACDFPEARTLLSARTVDLAASQEPNPPKNDIQTGEITPAEGSNILRHFVSSLDLAEKTPRAVADAIQGHWGCEVRHWERDTIWGEDKCRLRDPNAACALAIVRVAVKALLVGVRQKSVTYAIEDARESADLAISWLKELNLDG